MTWAQDRAVAELGRWSNERVISSVLEIGCGTGELCARLAALGFRNVTGLDRDRACIDEAKQRYPALDFRLGELVDFEASVDAVVCVAVLHHVERRRAYRALRSLLVPGGRLVAVGLHRSRLHLGAWRPQPRRRSMAPRVWPPPLSFAEVAEVTARELPGSEALRLGISWHLVRWTKPRPPGLHRSSTPDR